MAKVIPRWTTIPNEKVPDASFSTASDNQQTVCIRVFEGERALTRDNNLLGTFDLTGIPPAPRGVPRIEVTFSPDQNGVLNVSEIDKGTGRAASITIQNNGRLSQEGIDRMIKDAEIFAEEDAEVRERMIMANECASLISGVRDQVSGENGYEGELGADGRRVPRDTVNEVETWVEEEAAQASLEDLKGKFQEVQSDVARVTSGLYHDEVLPPVHAEL